MCAIGPSHWAEEYETCAGKFQSPIDIEEHLVTQVRLPPLHFHGFQSEPISSTLTNNGHTGKSSTNYVIMWERARRGQALRTLNRKYHHGSVILENIIVTETFIEPEGLLPYSQGPIIGP
jgi:carbonic anhydrase